MTFADTHPRTNDAFAQADAIGVASQWAAGSSSSM